MEIMTALLANQAVNGRVVTTTSLTYAEDAGDLRLRASAAVVVVAITLAILTLIGA